MRHGTKEWLLQANTAKLELTSSQNLDHFIAIARAIAKSIAINS